jgi:glucosyl-3-phosphoglycerate phosphatase
VSAAGRSRLVLVRHGETDWNATGRWQGHGGGGLSARGQEQARVTAEWLAATQGPITRIARSDLRRVAETSAPLERRLDVPVRVDQRLRELDCGSWSGLTAAEIRVHDPGRFAAWQAGADLAPGGGERVAEMQERATAALAECLAEPGAVTTVVVTHGGPIRVGVAGLLGRTVTRLDEAWPPVPNCSVTVLVDGDGSPSVERYGDVAHLDALANEPPAGGPL